MGHSNPNVTYQRYIHLFNRQETEEIVRTALQDAMARGKRRGKIRGLQRLGTDGNGISSAHAESAHLQAISEWTGTVRKSPARLPSWRWRFDSARPLLCRLQACRRLGDV